MASTNPRRAAQHGPRRAATIAPVAEETAASLVKHALATTAVSVLGLGLFGTITLAAGAQAVERSSSAVAGQGSPDSTQAQAAPPAPQKAGGRPVDHEKRRTEDIPQGSLDAFNRTGADGTARNAVRAEIDRAVADQKARERGASLALAEARTTETSGAAVQDARSTNLKNDAAATKREQARLADEKRKADEALKAGRPAPAAAAAPSGSSLPAAPAPAAGAPGVSGQGASPMAPGSYTIGARWGAVGPWARYHTGQDLPAPIGTPIRAAAPGVVMGPAAGAGWAGTHAVIKHADGTSTLYAHMGSMLVRPGQMVSAGEQVGSVGMTGRTFGAHLHFEHYPAGARPGDVYSTDDPYAWMLRLGVRL